MTYSENLEENFKELTYKQAVSIYAQHSHTAQDLVSDLGIHTAYITSDVLEALGY